MQFELNDLMKQVASDALAAHDFVADTRTLELEPSGSGGWHLASAEGINLPGLDTQAVGLSEHAHRNLATWCGIPWKYYERLLCDDAQDQLLARNVNHWFVGTPARRMVRTLHGDARAVLSDRYARIDNHDVLQVVLPAMMNSNAGWVFHQAAITDTRMYMKAVLPRVETAVEVGDPVQLGMVMSNSEVGDGRLWFRPFVLRLVCTNGMVMADNALSRTHLTAPQEEGYLSDTTKMLQDGTFLSKAVDLVHAMADPAMLETFVRPMREAAQVALPRPVEAAEVLAKKVALTDAEALQVRDEFLTGSQAPSVWGLVNGLTATARLAPNYDRQVHMEAAAGELLAAGRRGWRDLVEAAA